MKHRIILFPLLLASLLCLPGCMETFTGARDAVYEEVPTGQMVTTPAIAVEDTPDDVRAELQEEGYQDEQIVPLDELTDEQLQRIINNARAVERVIQQEVPEIILRPRETTQAAVDTVGMLPFPGAGIVSTALSAVLGAVGVWQTRRKSAYRRAAESLALTLDATRDVADQLDPEVSRRIEEVIAQARRAASVAKGVAQDVERIFAENESPTKV